LAWSPRRNAPLAPYRAGEFYTGHAPGVRHLRDPSFDTPLTLGVRRFPERIDIEDTRDGPVENWWVPCDACRDNPRLDVDICVVCNGTGGLQSQEDMDLQAARSEIAASDEDPLSILVRRGLDI
jgi:hypothetical protein